MAPRAEIVHRLPGRLRVKVSEKRRDTAWFAEVALHLEKLSGVERVEVSPLSGSVLIHHEPGVPLEQHLRQSELIQLTDPKSASPPVLDTLTDVVSRSDRALKRRTGGRANLRSLLILALVILAIVQSLRGRIMIPAISLVIFAMQLALQAKDRK